MTAASMSTSLLKRPRSLARHHLLGRRWGQKNHALSFSDAASGSDRDHLDYLYSAFPQSDLSLPSDHRREITAGPRKCSRANPPLNCLCLPVYKKGSFSRSLSFPRQDNPSPSRLRYITLVKADGARHRWLKAPAEEEPVIPKDAATVIPGVSALALGQPLSDKIAHRVGQIETVIRAKKGEILKPIHLARLLASPQGSLKEVGTAKVIPLINMVEGALGERQGVAVAEAALSLTNRFDRVVLTCMNQTNPLIRAIYRH